MNDNKCPNCKEELTYFEGKVLPHKNEAFAIMACFGCNYKEKRIYEYNRTEIITEKKETENDKS